MRDNQRSRVYRAERLAWSVYDDSVMRKLSLTEIERLVRRMSPVYEYGGRLAGMKRPIKVGAGQGARRACAYSDRVVFPLWARTLPVVCHEMAHIRAGLDHGHNGPFVSEYIRLVRHYIGPVEADVLRQAFREGRVKTR